MLHEFSVICILLSSVVFASSSNVGSPNRGGVTKYITTPFSSPRVNPALTVDNGSNHGLIFFDSCKLHQNNWLLDARPDKPFFSYGFDPETEILTFSGKEVALFVKPSSGEEFRDVHEVMTSQMLFPNRKQRQTTKRSRRDYRSDLGEDATKRFKKDDYLDDDELMDLLNRQSSRASRKTELVMRDYEEAEVDLSLFCTLVVIFKHSNAVLDYSFIFGTILVGLDSPAIVEAALANINPVLHEFSATAMFKLARAPVQREEEESNIQIIDNSQALPLSIRDIGYKEDVSEKHQAPCSLQVRHGEKLMQIGGKSEDDLCAKFEMTGPRAGRVTFAHGGIAMVVREGDIVKQGNTPFAPPQYELNDQLALFWDEALQQSYDLDDLKPNDVAILLCPRKCREDSRAKGIVDWKGLFMSVDSSDFQNYCEQAMEHYGTDMTAVIGRLDFS